MTRTPAKRRPSRPKPEPSPHTRSTPRRRPLNTYIVLAFVLIGGYWAWAVWQTGRFEEQFVALVAAGQPGLSMVETVPLEGGGDGKPEDTYTYRSALPTSGRHHPEVVAPGFYDGPQNEARLVHALEHGNIVIYYDAASPSVITNLRRWAVFFGSDEWAGLVVVPSAGMGHAVTLTAWGRKLVLDPFEAASAAAFLDKYRGRGPEKRVR